MDVWKLAHDAVQQAIIERIDQAKLECDFKVAHALLDVRERALELITEHLKNTQSLVASE